MGKLGLSTLGVLAATAMFFGAPAPAATVTLNTTIDLSKASISNLLFVGNFFGETQASPLVTPFTIAEGDTLIWNADFAGNTQLTVTNMILVEALFGQTSSSPYSNATLTGTIELLDAVGDIAFTMTKTYEDCGICTVFSQAEFPSAQPIPTVTFAGLRYTATISDYSSIGVGAMSFSGPSFGIIARSAMVASTFELPDPVDPVSPVPEPTSWALMLMGFGAIGAALRMRPTRAVPA